MARGRKPGSKNKPKLEPVKSKPSSKKTSRKTSPISSENTSTIKEIRSGLFEITEKRPWKVLKGPLEKFSETKKARDALATVREKEIAAGRNPYRIVLLPLGPKNEGLLP